MDQYHCLMERVPETEAEAELRDALKELEAYDCYQKCDMLEMQANVVLQSLWSSKLKSHLEAHKAKAKKPKSVLSDGMPHLFMGHAFASAVEKDDVEGKEKKHRRRREGRVDEAVILEALVSGRGLKQPGRCEMRQKSWPIKQLPGKKSVILQNMSIIAHTGRPKFK
jgi:hypothetical protein